MSRRFQFSLRSLFWMTLFIGLALVATMPAVHAVQGAFYYLFLWAPQDTYHPQAPPYFP